eukprot:gene1329-11411_t
MEEGVLLLIDVQKGFTDENGSFGKAFNPKIDLLQIQETLPSIKSCFKECQKNKIPILLVKSEFKHKQFPEVGLENLCVKEKNNDCEFTDNIFENFEGSKVITKTENSSMTSEEFVKEIDKLIKKKRYKFLVGGFSTNTCVRKTCLDLKEKYKTKIEIFISKDITASRSSSKEKENGRYDSKRFNRAKNQLTENEMIFLKDFKDF